MQALSVLLWEVAGRKPCAIRVQENRLCKVCASQSSPRILCKLVQGFLDRFFPCFPRHISPTAAADGWREGCLQAGAMTATQRAVACRRGRRAAVSVTVKQPVDTQDDVIFNEPGRRARVARGDGGDPMPRVPFGIRHWGGFADNISCVATGFASFMPASRRAKV